jgi:hypothetical protein
MFENSRSGIGYGLWLFGIEGRVRRCANDRGLMVREIHRPAASVQSDLCMGR